MAEIQNSKPQISNATVKKPSFFREMLSYVIHEEIEPRSKELVHNAITGTIDMIANAANKGVDKVIYPDGNSPKRVVRSNSSVSDYQPSVSYNTKVVSNDRQSKPSINTRSSIDVNYIWVDTEDEAKAIINSLIEEIDNYGKAKVSTLYDMVKVPTNFTDFKFGWTKNEVNGMRYYRDRGKFFIDLPKPVNIENI